MFACKWRATGKRQKRKGKQQELTGEGNSCGTFMRHLRLVWPFLLIAEASRVLCHLVMFLPAFLHWIYLKWFTAAIKSLFLFLAGLFIGLWLRNTPLDKKKIGNYRLVSLLRLAGVCQKSSYLMGFRAASRPVSLSNYIAFYVFFFFGFMFMPSFYAHL